MRRGEWLCCLSYLRQERAPTQTAALLGMAVEWQWNGSLVIVIINAIELITSSTLFCYHNPRPLRLLFCLILVISTICVMAWRCTGKTNVELINNMSNHNIISTEIAAAAMGKVDRANFVIRTSEAYEDSPQCAFLFRAPIISPLTLLPRSIGHGATISAPHMVRAHLAFAPPY